jgi:hypothetical protein
MPIGMASDLRFPCFWPHAAGIASARCPCRTSRAGQAAWAGGGRSRRLRRSPAVLHPGDPAPAHCLEWSGWGCAGHYHAVGHRRADAARRPSPARALFHVTGRGPAAADPGGSRPRPGPRRTAIRARHVPACWPWLAGMPAAGAGRCAPRVIARYPAQRTSPAGRRQPVSGHRARPAGIPGRVQGDSPAGPGLPQAARGVAGPAPGQARGAASAVRPAAPPADSTQALLAAPGVRGRVPGRFPGSRPRRRSG